MASCKRHVYQVMCEYTDNGDRRGRFGSVRYNSRAKRNTKKTKGVSKTPTNRRVRA